MVAQVDFDYEMARFISFRDRGGVRAGARGSRARN